MIAEYIKLEWDKKRKTTLAIGNFDLQASATVVPYRATVIARNAEVCQIDGMAKADTYDLSVAFADGESYLVQFWQQSTNLGTIKSLVGMASEALSGRGMDAVQDMMLPKILDASGQEAGQMSYIPVARDGLQSLAYWRLNFSNKTLDCYIVGINRGIYFCMYDVNQNMVATVEKRALVKNGKSCYTMYIAQDTWLQPVALMTAILHQQIYDDGDRQGLSFQGHKLNSFQKELAEKYHPEFIEQVKSQVQASDLPENMPLVQEKVKESQNTLQLILKRIRLAVFIVCFVVILLVFFMAKR